MRVLAGFESSWDWTAVLIVDEPVLGNPNHNGSGDGRSVAMHAMSLAAAKQTWFSISRGRRERHGHNSFDGNDFQLAMKQDHPLAMEYIARLLRHTVNHNGPVKRHEIDPWLRKDAVTEFLQLLDS